MKTEQNLSIWLYTFYCLFEIFLYIIFIYWTLRCGEFGTPFLSMARAATRAVIPNPATPVCILLLCLHIVMQWGSFLICPWKRRNVYCSSISKCLGNLYLFSVILYSKVLKGTFLHREDRRFLMLFFTIISISLSVLLCFQSSFIIYIYIYIYILFIFLNRWANIVWAV